jgi:hypothetical protein
MSDLEQLRLAPALRIRVNAGDIEGDEEEEEEEDGRGSLVVDSSISSSPIRQSSTEISKVVAPSPNLPTYLTPKLESKGCRSIPEPSNLP